MATPNDLKRLTPEALLQNQAALKDQIKLNGDNAGLLGKRKAELEAQRASLREARDAQAAELAKAVAAQATAEDTAKAAAKAAQATASTHGHMLQATTRARGASTKAAAVLRQALVDLGLVPHTGASKSLWDPDLEGLVKTTAGDFAVALEQLLSARAKSYAGQAEDAKAASDTAAAASTAADLEAETARELLARRGEEYLATEEEYQAASRGAEKAQEALNIATRSLAAIEAELASRKPAKPPKAT